MKIVDLKTYVVGNPPPHHGGKYFTFLKLVTDGGVEGVGEVYAVPFDPHVVAKMVEDVGARLVIGHDPFKIEVLWRKVYSSGYTQKSDLSIMGVLSGIEMACWDIIGKELNKPVYELLGGRIHEKLRSYTYIYPDEGEDEAVYNDPDAAAERAARYVKQGFTAVKFDPVGPYTAYDPRQLSLEALNRAEAFVTKLREAVGGQADLLFGTHGQMTASSALRLAKRLEPADPLWLRGAGAAGKRRGNGQGGARHLDPHRHRRAPRLQVPVPPGAASPGRLDPAAGARPFRRHSGSEKDRRHGRGPLRGDRPASLLRADRRGRQHPAGYLHPPTS